MIFSNIIPVKAKIAYDDSMAAVLEDQKMVIRGTSGTDERTNEVLAQKHKDKEKEKEDNK